MSRIRAAVDLSYYTAQAARHAVMLESFLAHGVPTSDVLIMVATDLQKCQQALVDYRNGIVNRDTPKHEQV